MRSPTHVSLGLAPALARGLALYLVPALTATLQAQPPRSIATVAVAVNGTAPLLGEMYSIDHETNTATQIPTPALFDTDRPNCVLMTSPVTGYVGSNPTVTTLTSNIYAITIGATGVVIGNGGQPLNTTATAGNNIAQLVIVGSGATARIYFVSQTLAAVGALQSIPLAGGPVTLEYDLATLPTANLTNAIAAFGNKIYVGTWSVNATSPGEVVEFDTSTKAAKKLLDLPFSQYQGTAGTTTYGFGCVNADILPNLNLGLVGIYGDELEVNVFTSTVVAHRFHGPKTSPYLTNSLINSGYFDPTTNDWVIGTRNGTVERWVENHNAANLVPGVGSHPTPASNSVSGVFHFPVANNSDMTYGAGCAVSASGLTPTDVSAGAAVAGNANFKLALYSGLAGQPFFMGLGASKLSVSFGNPSCTLLISPILAIGGTVSAAGTVSIPAPLPANLPKNSFVLRQWVMADGAGGVVTSNARITTIL